MNSLFETEQPGESSSGSNNNNASVALGNTESTLIYFPFQKRKFLQLLPIHYISRQCYIYTLPIAILSHIYFSLRLQKGHLSEITLNLLSSLTFSSIDDTMITYIRMKLGELLPFQRLTQHHELIFVDYSKLALSILYTEMGSIKYNICHKKEYYYPVWSMDQEKFRLTKDNRSEAIVHSVDSNKIIRYWMLFSMQQLKDFVKINVCGYMPCYIKEDNGDTIYLEFEKAFKNISKKVNQQILLNDLYRTCHCDSRLFPPDSNNAMMIDALSPNMKRHDPAFSEENEMRSQVLSKTANAKHRLKEEEKKEIIHDDYATRVTLINIKFGSLTPDEQFFHSFPVNERLSLDNLSDSRGRFSEALEVTNRRNMYVIADEIENNIYVLKFSQARNSKDGTAISGSSSAVMEISSLIFEMKLYGIEKPSAEFLNKLIMCKG